MRNSQYPKQTGTRHDANRSSGHPHGRRSGSAADRERIWKTIIPARAYDNRVYLACCNLIRKSDPSDKPALPGGCFVCGPEGEVLAEDFGEMSGVTVFEVDPALLARFRSGDDSMRYRYYPDKRRPELYTTEPSPQNVTLSSI